MGKTRRPRLEANRHFSPHHLVCSRRQTRDRDAGGPRAQAHLLANASAAVPAPLCLAERQGLQEQEGLSQVIQVP